MPKINKALIGEYKRLERAIKDVAPSIYASIAIPLVLKYGWAGEQVAELFADSQAEWRKSSDRGEIRNMIQRCDELTDIVLMRFIGGEDG